MKTQNTQATEDISHWKLRNQIREIFKSSFLRGRAILDFDLFNGDFNLPTQLHFQIKSAQYQKANSKNSEWSLDLLIKLSQFFPYEEPTFILSKSNQSTYRQKEIFLDQYWNLTWRLVDIIQNIVSYIDSNHIDLSFFDFNKTKVNLHLKQYKQIQGLNISKNSCFKFSGRQVSRQENQKVNGTASRGFKGYGGMENFRHSQKKRSNQPMKKNANLPKFLIRIFIKYVDKFKKLYPKKQFDRLNNQCKKMKQWKRSQNKQQALGLKHLKMLFQECKQGFPDPRLNRSIVIDIISRYLLQQICQNSQIPQTHRLGYLVACRVYALRCRNATLAGRIQSK